MYWRHSSCIGETVDVLET